MNADRPAQTPLAPEATLILDRAGAVQVLSGGPPAIPPGEVAALTSGAPCLRRIEGRTICGAPLADGRALVHVHDAVPPGVSVTQLMRAVEQAASEHGQDSGRADSFAQALARSAVFRPRKRPEGLAWLLTDTGFARQAIVVRIRGGRPRTQAYSSRELSRARSEIATVLRQAMADREAGSDAPRPTPTDRDLLADKLGGKRLSVFLPVGARGYAVVATDVPAEAAQAAAAQIGLLDLMRSPPWFAGLLGRPLAALIGLAAVAALLFWLAMPAPAHVSGAAQARAAQSLTRALPFPAYLERVHVRPGDDVRPGDPLANLRAPEIEDALAEARLTLGLEDLNAQEALQRNDPGALRLAQSRQELARTRIAQLERREAMLQVRAEVAGRVLSALPVADQGQFLPVGAELVRLAPGTSYDIQIEIAAGDAHLLAPDQSGAVFFTGLAGQQFPVRSVGVPVQVTDPQSGAVRLVQLARVTSPDQAALIPGLTGFARLEYGTGPRIIGLTRQARDYLRFTAWKLFGSAI